jgi:hypothetical protein
MCVISTTCLKSLSVVYITPTATAQNPLLSETLLLSYCRIHFTTVDLNKAELKSDHCLEIRHKHLK